MTKRYPNAPISEAVIDFQVEPEPELTANVLDQLFGESGEITKEEVFDFASKTEINPGVLTSSEARQFRTGFKYTFPNKKDIVVARLFGFTMSRLAPYETWESFRDEARRNWMTYKERAKPKKVKRIGVRYINRIDIPEEKIELREHFQIYPEMSSIKKYDASGFFMQVQFPQEDLGATVIVNQTLAPPPRPHVLSVALDIDIFHLPTVPMDEETIWNYLEKLRERKNEFFENSITEKSRKLFL